MHAQRVGRLVRKDADVDAWFSAKQPPAEPAMQRVRDIILGADRRMKEYVKYGQPCFGYGSDFAAFTKASGKVASIMFHRGARIPDPKRFPHMTGTHPSARFMTFKDVAEADARAKELAAIAVAWCDMPDDVRGAPPGAKAKASTKVSKKAKSRAKK